MKKGILVTCLLTSLFASAADKDHPKIWSTLDKAMHHTWFIFSKCTNGTLLEAESSIEFVMSLANKIGKKNGSIVLIRKEDTEKEESERGDNPANLTSLTCKEAIIYCSAVEESKEVHIDIYTHKMNFDRSEIGEFCKESLEASGYGMAFTTPQQ